MDLTYDAWKVLGNRVISDIFRMPWEDLRMNDSWLFSLHILTKYHFYLRLDL